MAARGRPVAREPGERMGQWTLIAFRPGVYEGTRTVQPAAWRCICACGVTRWVQSSNLYNGASQSCGHDNRRGGPRLEKNLAPLNSVFALGGQL